MKIKTPHLSKAENLPALMAAAVDLAEDAAKSYTEKEDLLLMSLKVMINPG
jgi:hypothetical protein